MKEKSLTISGERVLLLTVPVPDGLMIGETFTASVTLPLATSPSSAKTTSQWIWLDGSGNLIENESQMEGDSALWSISVEDAPMEDSNTPLSHSGCWCNSSEKRDTDD